MKYAEKKSIDPFIISEGAEGAATLPSTSHAEGAATSPSARVIPISQNITFEELLLDQVNVKTGRKRICGGAEVITSGEVSERMKKTVSTNVKDTNRQEKRKQPRQKKITKKKEESGDSEQLKHPAAI